MPPGNVCQPVQIIASGIELRRQGVQLRQLGKLVFHQLHHSFWGTRAEPIKAVMVLLDKGGLLVLLQSQLFLDLLVLLHQEVLSLVTHNLLLNLFADAGLKPDQVLLTLQSTVHHLAPE